jgi:hypothetical protein
MIPVIHRDVTAAALTADRNRKIAGPVDHHYHAVVDE